MSFIEVVRQRCEALPGATVDNVFGDDVDVFRVGNKMFALVGERRITLKTTPEESAALRSVHDWVEPGYHMNKRHWITIDLSASCDPVEVDELVEESYRLVVLSLPKSKRPSADDRRD